MSRIVHLQTTIQTTFGVLEDGSDDAIAQQPMVCNVAKFSEAAFVEAHAAIAAERDKAAAGLAEQQATKDNVEAAKRAARRPKR